MRPAEPNAYLKTKVLTADPAHLRLMLFEGAIKFAEQAKAGLESDDYEALYTGITRCQEILLELTNSLEPRHHPDLCQKLSSLYTYMYTRLMAATTERDARIVDEVLKLLRYEHETWAMVLERLAEENRAARALTDTPQAEPAKPGAGSDSTKNLIGGTVSVEG